MNPQYLLLSLFALLLSGCDLQWGAPSASGHSGSSRSSSQVGISVSADSEPVRENSSRVQ